MLAPSSALSTPLTSDQILIAIANTDRAAALKGLALEFSSNVVLVRDGQEAIQHLDRAGAPRLLITELSLPRVDGFGVLRHLRRTATAAQSPAIVVSPHESFRNAARQLAESLGISKILPLDVDHPLLRRAMAGLVAPEERSAKIAPRATTPAIRAAGHVAASLDERINRALFELTCQHQVPMAAGYWNVRDERRFAVYASVTKPPASFDWSILSELLVQTADGAEPLVVPELEDHPLFGRATRSSAVRGFAGAPLIGAGDTTWGALGLFDYSPLALTAGDVDTFEAYTRGLGSELAPQPVPLSERTPEAIERDFQALEQLAATDPLTGLANRRGCEKSIAGEISRAERERKPLSCIMLDIDRFKQVNDTLGHQAGDQVLRELSAMLRHSVRAYDIVARWGGEEFLVILPGADLSAARLLAERIRVSVQKLPTSSFGSVTISAGVAEFDADYDFEATLRVADRRLYEAKGSGRNCVV